MIGKIVQIIHPDSVKHRDGYLATQGTVIAVDDENYVGTHHRPIKVEFNNPCGTVTNSWWARNELKILRRK